MIDLDRLKEMVKGVAALAAMILLIFNAIILLALAFKFISEHVTITII